MKLEKEPFRKRMFPDIEKISGFFYLLFGNIHSCPIFAIPNNG
jgi:hypothetical protein